MDELSGSAAIGTRSPTGDRALEGAIWRLPASVAHLLDLPGSEPQLAGLRTPKTAVHARSSVLLRPLIKTHSESWTAERSPERPNPAKRRPFRTSAYYYEFMGSAFVRLKKGNLRRTK